MSVGGAQKRDWRSEHKDFIKNIREAKKLSSFMKAGGDVRDLPPVSHGPASVPSDYVNCQHCGRNFNQTAGARHIPMCRNIINKPKPPPSSNRYR